MLLENDAGDTIDEEFGENKNGEEVVITPTFQHKLLSLLGFEHIQDKKRNALFLILVIVFLDLFGVGLVYPMIPFYAERLVCYFSLLFQSIN